MAIQRPPLPPYDEPLAVLDGTAVYAPDPRGEGTVLLALGAGILIGWDHSHAIDGSGLFLCLFTRSRDDELGFATKLTREGLQVLIADLRSIEEQLGCAAAASRGGLN